MAYLALEFEATSEVADRWSDALLEAGALAVDLADAQAGTAEEQAVYGEPGEVHALWARSRVLALFAGDTDLAAALHAAASALGIKETPHWSWHRVDEQDWVRLTQAQFGPIRISSRLWIVPSWCRPVDAKAINIALDPGLAFGTGSHPTTRLCLEWLDAHTNPAASVLDYGCGSGLLAIAAELLGAGVVHGVDIDPQAVAAAAANAQANAVQARFFEPAELPPGNYDVVVANILTNPLCSLAPLLSARVRPGGTLLLSGILAEQTDRVAMAYAPWVALECWAQSEGWAALVGTRKR